MGKNIYQTPGLRLVQLYVLMSSTGRSYSLGRLAKIFKCSRQTILRMMDQVCCIPQTQVESWLEGKERVYRIPVARDAKNIALNQQTIHYLLLCQRVVSHLFPLAGESNVPLLEKELGATSLSGNGSSAAFANSWVKGRIDYLPFQDILMNIHKALREQRLCQLTYRAHTKKQPREYLVAPSSIVVYREALYLRCQLFDGPKQPTGDFRTFAVHRILALKLEKHRYEAAEAEEREPLFGFPYHDPIKVRIAFWGGAASYIAERTWSEDQKLTRRRDGTVVLSFSTTSRLEVISWVLSFGGEAELLSPKDLREELVEKVREIAGRYRRKPIHNDKL